MKISVVIPNLILDPQMAHIAAMSIDSVSAALTPQDELILIDNNSPENVDFLKERASIYLRNETRQGVSQSWNQGIKAASGDWILFANNDIIIREGWRDIISECFQLEKVMVASIWHKVYCFTKQSDVDLHHWSKAQEGIYVNHKHFSGPFFVVPRSTIEKVGLFDEDYGWAFCEETDYLCQVVAYGGNYATAFKGMVLHYDQMTTSKTRKLNPGWWKKNHALFWKKWGFRNTSLSLNIEKLRSGS